MGSELGRWDTHFSVSQEAQVLGPGPEMDLEMKKKRLTVDGVHVPASPTVNVPADAVVHIPAGTKVHIYTKKPRSP